ncbi:hypothetical protein KP509_08G060300 [Ceratopteris richardii]|uniref:phosphatidate cytidylyltransferase n=1 Tax=Ceratopteris richardii TaxID=49495 RepID=A0A8T2UCX5_CERRI|nr:hypothetical protein KP509_08G060300 [Ceratopteris richardii]
MNLSQSCIYASEKCLPVHSCDLRKFTCSSHLRPHYGRISECHTVSSQSCRYLDCAITSSCPKILLHISCLSPSIRPQEKFNSCHISQLFCRSRRRFSPSSSNSQNQDSCQVVTAAVGELDSSESKAAAEPGVDKEEVSSKDVEGKAIDAVDAHASIDDINEKNDKKKPKSQMLNRVVFGTAIGLGMGGAIVVGGWCFTTLLAGIVYLGTREYFQLVRSDGISDGMTPPPRSVSRACSIICASMPLMTLYFGGRVSVAVTTAAFVLAIVLLLQREKPRFAQFSSVIFGLFYCGYLPSFWIKLRCGTAIPALNSKVTPLFWKGAMPVGLIATLIAASSIIAADTGAFLGGKYLGRTPLSNVSPKKTLEGAIFGLSSAILVTLLLTKLFSWPPSMLKAAAFGMLIFLGSLFGDLTESMIKRDAGVKDSGRLIPGHGGILDRADSYIFTGALAYSFIKILL